MTCVLSEVSSFAFVTRDKTRLTQIDKMADSNRQDGFKNQLGPGKQPMPILSKFLPIKSTLIVYDRTNST